MQTDSVRVECDKLVVKIDGCLEAVFALEFELPQDFFVPDELGRMRTQYPVLLLYDEFMATDFIQDWPEDGKLSAQLR